MHKKRGGFVAIAVTLLTVVVVALFGGGYLLSRSGDKNHKRDTPNSEPSASVLPNSTSTQTITKKQVSASATPKTVAVPKKLEQKEADEILWDHYDKFFKLVVPSGDLADLEKINDNDLLRAEEKFFTPESLAFIKNNPQYQRTILFYGLSVHDSVQKKMEHIRSYVPLTEAEKTYYRTLFVVKDGKVTYPPAGTFPSNQIVNVYKDGRIDFPPPHLAVVVDNDRIGWNVEGFGMDLVKSGGDWKFDIVSPDCLKEEFCEDPASTVSQ